MLSIFALGVCLSLPTNATVVDPFRAPECSRCAGNRGIEYAVPSNSVVRSGLDGRVVFAGMVAGVQYVVVRASANPLVRVTYGGIAEVAVAEGDEVVRGTALGTMGSSISRDVSGAVKLHLGVRVGQDYVDPLAMARGGAVTPRFRVTLGRGPAHACVRGP
jgi:murein DD-endopeptidase MepM/ murein hydrolase activator NlpD